MQSLSFERLQYAELQKEWPGERGDQGPSTTYGAEHLSRLLGKSNKDECLSSLNIPTDQLSSVSPGADRPDQYGCAVCESSA